jgi:large subunit ribosomal protein L11
MKKKAIANIRLTLMAGKAAPSPILGQALGQYGINIMEFCKNFNNQTKNIKEQVYIPVRVQIYSKDSFQVSIKTPTTTYILKQLANIAKASSSTKKKNLQAYVHVKEIYHLALLKKCDRELNSIELKSLCKTIIGSAKSMGLGIKATPV